MIFFAFALIDLVQVAAHAQEDAAGTGGHEEGFVEFVAGLFEVFHAVGLGEHAAAVEGVNVYFLTRTLKAAQKVPGQTNAGDGKFQPPAHAQINHTQRNGVAEPPINYAVEVAVLRIVIIFLIPSEALFLEKKLVDAGDESFRRRAKI